MKWRLQSTLRIALLVAISYRSFSQTIGETLAFDAASVKPARPPAESFGDGVSIARKQPGRSRRGGPGTDDPSRFYDPETTVQTLLVEAFDVGHFQVQGPEWLSEERFDVEATMPPQTTMIQFHSMLQNLLVEIQNFSAPRTQGASRLCSRRCEKGSQAETAGGIPRSF